MLIEYCLLKVLWKIRIGGWIVFEYVSSWILLLSLTLLNIQLISYSILMGQLFNSFSKLFVMSIIKLIVLLILSFNNFNEIIFCLNPYFSLIYILRYLFLNERSMINVGLNKRLYVWSPSLVNVYVMIIVSILMFWILIWYFEKINPGEIICFIK
jgi:hypothetical protein